MATIHSHKILETAQIDELVKVLPQGFADGLAQHLVGRGFNLRRDGLPGLSAVTVTEDALHDLLHRAVGLNSISDTGGQSIKAVVLGYAGTAFAGLDNETECLQNIGALLESAYATVEKEVAASGAVMKGAVASGEGKGEFIVSPFGRGNLLTRLLADSAFELRRTENEAMVQPEPAVPDRRAEELGVEEGDIISPIASSTIPPHVQEKLRVVPSSVVDEPQGNVNVIAQSIASPKPAVDLSSVVVRSFERPKKSFVWTSAAKLLSAAAVIAATFAGVLLLRSGGQKENYEAWGDNKVAVKAPAVVAAPAAAKPAPVVVKVEEPKLSREPVYKRMVALISGKTVVPFTPKVVLPVGAEKALVPAVVTNAVTVKGDMPHMPPAGAQVAMLKVTLLPEITTELSKDVPKTKSGTELAPVLKLEIAEFTTETKTDAQKWILGVKEVMVDIFRRDERNPKLKKLVDGVIATLGGKDNNIDAAKIGNNGTVTIDGKPYDTKLFVEPEGKNLVLAMRIIMDVAAQSIMDAGNERLAYDASNIFGEHSREQSGTTSKFLGVISVVLNQNNLRLPEEEQVNKQGIRYENIDPTSYNTKRMEVGDIGVRSLNLLSNSNNYQLAI